MDRPLSPKVRLSDLGEVAAAVPALVGFVPHESIVLLSLRGPGGRRVGVTARGDLPPGNRSAAAMALQLAHGVARDDPDSVLVVVYSEDPDERELLPVGLPDAVVEGLPHRAVVHDVTRALTALRIPMRDAILVRGGRWWSYDCPYPCCAPGAGTPLPGGTSEATVATVLAGGVVERDRAALQARIARGPATDACAVAVQEVGTHRSWQAVLDALHRCRPGSTAALPDAVVAAVVWALTDLGLRDRALGLALGADAVAAETLWTECTRRAPAPLDAAPATLLAVSAWLRGDGAMANIAVHRALTSRPGYRLAELVADGLAAGIPPAEVRTLIADAVGDGGRRRGGRVTVRAVRGAATPRRGRARPGRTARSRTRRSSCRA